MVRPLAESASLSGRKTPTASSSSSSPPADQENRPKPVVATPPTVFAHPARRSYTKGHLRAAQRRMFQDLDDVELDHQRNFALSLPWFACSCSTLWVVLPLTKQVATL